MSDYNGGSGSGRFLASVLLFFFIFLVYSYKFYLPNAVPHNYTKGEDVPLTVNKLSSSKAGMDYEYYKLPFCKSEKIQLGTENLGEVLTENKIEKSPYHIKFLVEEQCKLVCRQVYSFIQIREFVSKIKEDYMINWIVDELPSAWRLTMDAGQDVEHYQGFPLGGTLIDAVSGDMIMHYLNNHHKIIIKYHMPDSNQVSEWRDDSDPNIIGATIVGFYVEPFSVKHTYKVKWDDASPPSLTSCLNLRHEYTRDYAMSLDGFSEDQVKAGDPKTIKKRKQSRTLDSLEVIWTYDVLWEESDIRWATRWDVYLNANAKRTDEVHWFAIVNPLLIVVFISGMVAIILVRTLRRVLLRYNRVPTEEEKAEDRDETGWKLVHGDVVPLP